MKNRLPLHFESATRLARMLRQGKVTARELLRICRSRIEAHNPRLNAVIVTDFARAEKAARAADRRLRRGEPKGPLDGVPITIKESFDWTGTPSTWGAVVYRDNIARSDAVAVERLTQAGAIVLGKTNVPLMLADWQSFNEIYGTTNNPWDETRAPGGSSGGSAVALATGMSALEIGSDIAASIRNPAHYCGVYGHKPTFGVVPMRGHFLPSVFAPSDISVAGPLARSAADLELAMKLLAGPEGIDAEGYTYRLKAPRGGRLSDFRVSVMLSDPMSEVDRPVQDLLSGLASFLENRVANLSMTARPQFTTGEAMDVYIALLRAATSRRQSDAEFLANSDTVKTLSADDHTYLARMLRAQTMAHRDWLSVNHRRHDLRHRWNDFFKTYDVLLCPAAASAAFPHDHQGERHERTILVNGKRVPATDQLFWAGYSGGFYLPSTVAPIGLTAQGLPAGVQIVAAEHDDMTAIRFAALLEQEYYSFRPPPAYV